MKSLNTFYDTLQVPRNATVAALRTAHKTLSERLLPDRNPENPGATARQLQQVNKALEVLTHPHARDAYDAWLGQRIGAMGDVGVPTLPELVQSPSQASASAKASSEALAPLPTLDLEGFAAEVAAKAGASTAAAATTAQTPAPPPLSSPVAKPAGTAASSVKSASLPPPSVVPALSTEPALKTPSTPSGFAETQPYHPSDVDDLPDLEASNRKAAASTAPKGRVASQATAAQRSAPLKALDWLRERPIALVAAALLCVLLVAFAPWLWHAAFGVRRSEVPATPTLQPTYVEPPVEAVSAPAASTEPIEPVEAVGAVEGPSTQPSTESKPAHKAKPRKVVKRVAEPRRMQESVAPVQQPEPVVAPVPVDPGGHSGYAPKCRWVTPTNWSCK